MSYRGLGSYFAFSPHEVYAGMGSYYEIPYPMSGFGAAAGVDFDPDRVMSNIAKSDACYGPGGACVGDKAGTPICTAAQGGCNYAGQQANKEIAVALNALGYGPIAVDGTISWQNAYSKFLSDHGLTKGPGFGITRQALLTMKQDLDQGKTPGPKPPEEYEKVNGEYIPKGKPEGISGVSPAALLVGAAVIGGIGYLAYRSGKKRKGSRLPRM